MEKNIFGAIDCLPVVFSTEQVGNGKYLERKQNSNVLYIFPTPKTDGFISSIDDVKVDGIGTEEFCDFVMSPFAECIEDYDNYKLPPPVETIDRSKVKCWIGWEINTKVSGSSVLTLGYITLDEILKVTGPIELSNLRQDPNYQKFICNKVYNHINIKRSGQLIKNTNGFDYEIKFDPSAPDLNGHFDPKLKDNKLPTIYITRLNEEDTDVKEWHEVIQADKINFKPLINNRFLIHAQFNPYYDGQEITDFRNWRYIISTIGRMDTVLNFETNKMVQTSDIEQHDNTRYITTVNSLNELVLEDETLMRDKKFKIHIFEFNGKRINILEIVP